MEKTMAQYNAGTRNSQNFSVSVFQTGKNYIDVSLRSDLFPAGEQSDLYVVGVESLQVPLSATRLFDETNPANAPLMYLRRRLRGAPNDAAHTKLHGADGGAVQLAAANQHWTEEGIGVLRTDKDPIREIGDLFELINRYTIKINNSINRVTPLQGGGSTGGLNAPDFTDVWNVDGQAAEIATFNHFYIRMNPSGVVEIVGSTLFWNNFFLEISPYGQEVFGLSPVVGLTIANNVAVLQTSVEAMLLLNVFTTTQAPHPAANAYTIANDNYGRPYRAAGKVSCWEAVDTRLSVALATEIPLQRNIIINDGSEGRSYFLCNYALDQASAGHDQDSLRHCCAVAQW